jgi:hypothetical protein
MNTPNRIEHCGARVLGGKDLAGIGTRISGRTRKLFAKPSGKDFGRCLAFIH